MGHGLGPDQKAILRRLYADSNRKGVSRRQIRENLPYEQNTPGSARVKRHRAIKSLESRGLIRLIATEEWWRRGHGFGNDTLKLTAKGIKIARALTEAKEV